MQSNTTHMQTVQATLDAEMNHAIDECVRVLNTGSKVSAARAAIVALISDTDVKVMFDDSTIYATMPEGYVQANVKAGMTTSNIIRDCLIRGARLLTENKRSA